MGDAISAAVRRAAVSPHVQHGRGSLARAAARFGNRFVEFAEDLLDEDIDAKLARIPRYLNEVGYDPFGGDLRSGRYVLTAAAFLHRKYFRSKVTGIDKLPPGRLLIVANHSGQLPIDGVILGAALMLDAEPPRFPRSMVEKWVAELPFLSYAFPRIGQVLGLPENGRRLLEQEQTLLVFPEGVAGVSKTFDRRYQLEPFGLGFMRLALETNTPIVPVGIVGAEEQYVSIADIKPLARLLGMPSFPIIPQVLLTGLLPLPTRYHIHFGDPLRFEGDPDDEDSAIAERVAVVRHAVQSLLQQGLRERRSVFL